MTENTQNPAAQDAIEDPLEYAAALGTTQSHDDAVTQTNSSSTQSLDDGVNQIQSIAAGLIPSPSGAGMGCLTEIMGSCQEILGPPPG